MADATCVIHLVGDATIPMNGTVEEVADQLRPSNATPSGFIPVTDVKGRTVLVNRDQVTHIRESTASAVAHVV